MCRGRVFGEGGDDGGVRVEVAGVRAVKGAGFNVKDVDEHADGAEDVWFLRGQVGFCEGILSVQRDSC